MVQQFFTLPQARHYLDANLAIKEALLAKTTPIPGKVIRYKPTDRLLEFLQAL